ncbi:MAG TPA: hypothetical protein GXX15_12790 [Clostridia bacterium]|nr:hypothetical protein [Clostridia bacterium]
MIKEFLKRALQISLWIILVATVLLIFEERGSAEYFITLFSLIIGVIFLSIALIVYYVHLKRAQKNDT